MVESSGNPKPESPRDTRIINALADYAAPWMIGPDATMLTKGQTQDLQQQALEVLREEHKREYRAGGESERLAAYLLKEQVTQAEIDAEIVDYFKRAYKSAIEARIAQQHFDGSETTGSPFDLKTYEVLYGIIPRQDIPNTTPVGFEEAGSPDEVLNMFGVHPDTDTEDTQLTAIRANLTQSAGSLDRHTPATCFERETPQYSDVHPELLDQAFGLYDESRGNLDTAATNGAFHAFARLCFEDELRLGLSEFEIAHLLLTNPDFRREIIGHYKYTRLTRNMPHIRTNGSDNGKNLDNV